MTEGKPAPISKIVEELADPKGALPYDSISDYAQRFQFLDVIEAKLERNVELRIKENDILVQIVPLLEGDDATIYKTRVYKDSGTSQNTSK